jgi:hypothetical protein
VFIFTSNFRLPNDDEVKEARDKGQSKAVLLGHKNAIRSRCRTQDFDMDKDTQWGWIADVVLNTDAVDEFIETDDEKRILLDWMKHRWDQMTERSIRTVEKMAQSMEEDPTGYKAKIMDKGAQKSVEKTVRKLKSEQSNVGGASLGVNQAEKETTRKSSTRKIQRPTNIFKRI